MHAVWWDHNVSGFQVIEIGIDTLAQLPKSSHRRRFGESCVFWRMFVSLALLLLLCCLCMLEGLEERCRGGVWCIPVIGLESENHSNRVVPPCGKFVLLKRRPSLHCFGAACCLTAPLRYMHSSVGFVSTDFNCFHLTGLRYLAVRSPTPLQYSGPLLSLALTGEVRPTTTKAAVCVSSFAVCVNVLPKLSLLPTINQMPQSSVKERTSTAGVPALPSP